MTSRNKRLAAMRLYLHGQVCASSDFHCVGDLAVDHARRTQHENAKAIVDAPDSEQRRRAVHDTLCIYAALGIECYDGTDNVRHPAGDLDRLLARVEKVLGQV